VERGTHHTLLLQENSLYRRLHSMQA
jgi:ABC-type multidrug transport system fused ATPase/permease subunit